MFLDVRDVSEIALSFARHQIAPLVWDFSLEKPKRRRYHLKLIRSPSIGLHYSKLSQFGSNGRTSLHFMDKEGEAAFQIEK